MMEEEEGKIIGEFIIKEVGESYEIVKYVFCKSFFYKNAT